MRYSVFEQGSRGEEVQRLQQRLIDLGCLQGEANGIFGVIAQDAICLLQKATGIEVTDIADSVFQNYLYSVDAITREGRCVNMINHNANLVIISTPSGCGKDTKIENIC